MELPQVFPHARSRRRFGHFAGIFLPVLILFILCFGSVLYVDYARLRERMESDQSELVSLTVVAFQNFYSSINSDLDGLARELAITRLVNGDDTAIPEIEFLFTNFAERRQIFDQVRLIGANGQETVRINFRDGVTEVVAEPDLQNQSDRYYFSATMEAAPNQLYVSDFDLNVESGIIETPIRPVVRLGIPLQRDDGSRWGILILNLNGTALINSIRNVAENNNSEIWLLNQDGYFLVGPNQEDEWAFMFPDRADRTLAQQNPALWNKLRGEPTIGFDHEGDWYTRYPFCGDLSCRFSYQLQQDPSASIDLDLPSAAHFLVSRISAENLGFAVVLAPNFSQWTPLGGLLFALVSAVGAISWQFARSFDRIRIRDDQLIQQQALLDGFVTHNPNAMFVHDLQGNYLLAN
ncbi:MAG: cache domain-containing protein, partial [Gammaproteobacteria bacterium]